MLKYNVLSGIFPEIRGMGNADYKQPSNRHELAFSRSHPRVGEWVVCLSVHACYMKECVYTHSCVFIFNLNEHTFKRTISHTHTLLAGHMCIVPAEHGKE